MRTTLVDVASLAGVSKGTVSRVINNKGYISEKTKGKVEKAIKELNYYPNEVARSVSNRKSFIIGMIIPTTNHPFWGEIIYYVERRLKQLGYKLMLCNSLNNVEKENRHLELLLSNQVDGIIVSSYNSNRVDYNIPILPIVAIDHFISDRIPTVAADNYQGGNLAVKELIKVGCKNIVTVSGVKNKKDVINMRLKAYTDLMKKYNYKSYSLELDHALTKSEKRHVMYQYLKENPEIDGVFAQDDETASHVLSLLESIQKKVPEDVKVVGYDGTKIVRQLMPNLTTIEQPIEKMATAAVDMLINKIEENKKVNNIIYPVHLIKGATTRIE